MPGTRHAIVAATVTAILVLAGGCVRAEKVRYRRHLSTIVQPAPGDVALGARDEKPKRD